MDCLSVITPVYESNVLIYEDLPVGLEGVRALAPVSRVVLLPFTGECRRVVDEHRWIIRTE